jgi:hypothetical protein
MDEVQKLSNSEHHERWLCLQVQVTSLIQLQKRYTQTNIAGKFTFQIDEP